MADVVIDASVVVKWYIPEQHHEAARTLRDEYLAGTVDLLAPTLMPFEAINALKYSGQYDGTRLVEAAQSISEYGIELVPFDRVGAVAALATEHEITVYDAAYLALAQQFDTTAYTADETLLAELDGAGSELLTHISTYS